MESDVAVRIRQRIHKLEAQLALNEVERGGLEQNGLGYSATGARERLTALAAEAAWLSEELQLLRKWFPALWEE